MVGKLAVNSIQFTRGLVKYVPGGDYFRAVPFQNGDKFATSPTPPIVERLTVANCAQNGSPLSDSRVDGHPHRGIKRFTTKMLAVLSSVNSAAVTANISARRLKQSVKSRM